eukprot:1924531-Rhodomonas_salina.4
MYQCVSILYLISQWALLCHAHARCCPPSSAREPCRTHHCPQSLHTLCTRSSGVDIKWTPHPLSIAGYHTQASPGPPCARLAAACVGSRARCVRARDRVSGAPAAGLMRSACVCVRARGRGASSAGGGARRAH